MDNAAIDGLHRRPPGSRLLVYLDQSVLSCLPDPAHAKLLDTLRRGIQSGRLVCPLSSDHEYETVLASRSFEEISDLSDELSMGVAFRDREDVWRNEVLSAAAAFLGQPAPMGLWQEAFETDPQAPLKALFPVQGFRVSIKSERSEWMQEEAQHEKSHTAALNAIFDQRTGDADFEQQVAGAFQAQIWRYLRPLVDVNFNEWVKKSWVEAKDELARGEDTGRAGSALSRFQYRRGLGRFSAHLLRTHAGLHGRVGEFVKSETLRAMPSLYYPALLMAALCCTPGRKVRDGDIYDMQHLTQGLSRCDIVTADGAWTQWCRQRGLVPNAVRLFSSRELDLFRAHLETLLSETGGRGAML